MAAEILTYIGAGFSAIGAVYAAVAVLRCWRWSRTKPKGGAHG